MRIAIARRVHTIAWFVVLFSATSTQPWTLLAQSGRRPAAAAAIHVDDLREWLGYLASDDLQGRQVFTEGYGLAAQYVATHLKEWGVKPLGGDGTYLQPVKVKGYKVTRSSSVTVDVNGQSRTFKHGDHVTFPTNGGGKQTLTFSGVEFLGYGQPSDLEGRNLKGKLVVTVPNLAPARGGAGGAAAAANIPAGGGRGGRGASAAAIAAGASAAIAFAAAPAAPTPVDQALAQAQTAFVQAQTALTQAQQAARSGRAAVPPQGGRGAPAPPDVTTVQRVDALVAPQFVGDDTFLAALFGDEASFAAVKAKAEKGEALPPQSLAAKVTIVIDNGFEIVSQQVTHNVVGVVEGSDPKLRGTYVVLGAHLDHTGYSQTGAGRGSGNDACRRRGPAAQAAVTAAGKVVQRPATGRRGAPGGGGGAAAAPSITPLDERDVINNGADDDGSGSASLMAIAKAFATGPRPRRSVMFVWHAGEESGLLGSRYNADYPAVPLDSIQAFLNMDMVGRDDCDNIEGDYTNTLFVVGADRISTDLHNVIVETNGRLKAPLTLDYELNDAQDPENIYTRSDHFSYASKGIPVAFFTTGLHPDYHRVTDNVSKILFPKMARVADLVYQTGFAIANSERPLERDNKGTRTGFGSKAEILK
ncbi:MAG TPA: M28 family peptidase [Vicinamibacterales bacterium]|nr:M28 family peptidase [Vicinamibacterales bacterium]